VELHDGLVGLTLPGGTFVLTAEQQLGGCEMAIQRPVRIGQEYRLDVSGGARVVEGTATIAL
jgi:hypothetical protein